MRLATRTPALPAPAPWCRATCELPRTLHRRTTRCEAAAPSDSPAAEERSRPRAPVSPAAQQSNVVPGAPPAPQPQASASAAAPAPDGEEEEFNWLQQWYPLAPVSYLDPAQPTAYTVLGQRLAVWYQAPTRQWRAFADRCPHRLAPLSEGKVLPGSGNLACSYHGWQFDGAGACAAVPQADSPQQEAAARRSLRACVASFPVREAQGMLWVWMDASPAGAAAAAGRVLPLPPGLLPVAAGAARSDDASRGVLLGGWYQRELPMAAEQLLENLLDPAHVHFAHDGVIGSPSRAGSIPLRQEGPLSTQAGFTLHMSRQWQGRATGWASQPRRAGGGDNSGGVPATTRFVPPSLVWLEFPAGELRFSMLFYAVPVGPSTSRLFAGYAAAGLPPALRSVLGSDALAPLAHALQFLSDLGAHEVIDGDTVHIHQQGRAVAAEGRAYFMPAAADRGVALLARWLDECAGGGPPWPAAARAAAAAAPPLTRRQLLDRYEQHTAACPSCRRALSTVRTLRQGLQLGTASAFGAAFALAAAQALAPAAAGVPALLAPPGARGAGASLPLALALGGLLAGAAQQALALLEQRFVFVDYRHGERG